jgi:GAF domain-containing protein
MKSGIISSEKWMAEDAQHNIALLRERVLRILLIGSALAVLLALVPAMRTIIQTGTVGVYPILLGVSGIILLGLYAIPGLPYTFRFHLFFVMWMGAGITKLLTSGLASSGWVLLLGAVVLAIILEDLRKAAAWIALNLIVIVVLTWMVVNEVYTVPASTQSEAEAWLEASIIYFGVILAVGVAQFMFSFSQSQALQLSRHQAEELEETQAKLIARTEQQERAYRELDRRARYLATTGEVSRVVAAILDLDELLERVVTLISKQFGFYHAGIFLLDDVRTWAVLRAVSSEGGRRMLARNHRLQVGAEGIVGYVSASGRPRIALDVSEDMTWVENPDLPETRSEVALPLMVGDDVIGVLDVQSKEPSAFAQEDVTILRILADQIAVAIQNARLFRENQRSLRELQRAYGEELQRGWGQRAREIIGYRYTPIESRPLTSHSEIDVPMVTEAEPKRLEDNALAVPLLLGGEVLGTLHLQRSSDRPWTDREITFIQKAITDIAQALENTRLLVATRERAAQERILSDISGRVRETLDVDMMLQTAVREIGQVLDLTEVEVRLQGRDTRSTQ